MKRWRRESALDLYNLVLAAVLLASPWLFTLTNRAGNNRPARERGGCRRDLDRGYRRLRKLGRVGQCSRGPLAHWLTLDPGICPYPRDAFQHRPRRDRDLYGVARAVAGI